MTTIPVASTAPKLVTAAQGVASGLKPTVFPDIKPDELVTIQRIANQAPKSPLARTLNGLKAAGWKGAWTGLWSLLALKGAALLCGVGAIPFLFPAIKSGKAMVKQFKAGYTA
jgi:hypothetical protein